MRTKKMRRWERKKWIHFKLAKEFKETFLLKQYFRVYGYGMRQKWKRKKKQKLGKVYVVATSTTPSRYTTLLKLLFTYENDVCSSLCGSGCVESTVDTHIKCLFHTCWKLRARIHTHSDTFRKSISIMHIPAQRHRCLAAVFPGKSSWNTLFFLIKLLFLSRSFLSALA